MLVTVCRRKKIKELHNSSVDKDGVHLFDEAKLVGTVVGEEAEEEEDEHRDAIELYEKALLCLKEQLRVFVLANLFLFQMDRLMTW